MATSRTSYPLAFDSATLLARLGNRAAIELRGDANTTLEAHEATGERVVIVTRTAVPLDWLPAAVRGRSLPGADGPLAPPDVRRVETWLAATGGGLAGTMDLEISGVPAQASGSMTATDRGTEGSVVEVRIDLAVRVPLVGGLIERAILGQIDGALREEFAALAGAPGRG